MKTVVIQRGRWVGFGTEKDLIGRRIRCAWLDIYMSRDRLADRFVIVTRALREAEAKLKEDA